jgi:hypothetical protein
MGTQHSDAATTEKKVSVRRSTEEQLHEKQAACKNTRVFWGGEGNIVPGTLRYEETGTHANKQTVEIHTIGLDGQPDGQKRRVATSDLHQVHHTVEVAEELKKAKRREAAKARREKVKAAMALLEAQNAE